jgi:hypothetical protein
MTQTQVPLSTVMVVLGTTIHEFASIESAPSENSP